MACQGKALNMVNRTVKKIMLSVFFTVVLTSGAAAATDHYKGNGISFDAPSKYTLTEKTKKSSRVITLKSGWDVIEIRVMDNVLFDGYDEVIVKALTKQFKGMGYGISDVTKETKQIPLQVKGDDTPVNVDTVKFNQTIGVVEGDVHINLLQTMFFFSYGDHGYTVDYRRAKGNYSDLITVLASFTFDHKEVAQDTEKSGVY